jgi:hypothetical protein
MAKVKIQGNASGTGVLTISAPNTDANRTITLPDGDVTLGAATPSITDNGDANAITIDADEKVGVGISNPYGKLHVKAKVDGNGRGLYLESAFSATSNYIYNSHASLASATTLLYTARSGSSAFEMLRLASAGAGDTEFEFRGDGQAWCDGAWNGGGADYAEYFEWLDGNPSDEDRRGISVTLEGDKIKPAIDGDSIIGVISGNPSVVGDTDIGKWKQKHLRDDFGSYIWEVDPDVDQDNLEAHDNGLRRKLNPAWDADVAYVSREDRQEWVTVGLMGKLRIRKGQPVDSRWIKMKDISDTVEEWLIK